MEKPALRAYIEDEFGSEDGLIREILGDFFRHGFDGSGADNFFDAGSCIDGRLTSAWNWCSMLEKKRFFPVFLLTGESAPALQQNGCGLMSYPPRVYRVRWRMVDLLQQEHWILLDTSHVSSELTRRMLPNMATFNIKKILRYTSMRQLFALAHGTSWCLRH